MCNPVYEISLIVYEQQINTIQSKIIALIYKSLSLNMVTYFLLGFIMIKNTFDPEKSVEAIQYIASKTPIPDPKFICKILYFADRMHLEKFGRLITGDNYIALVNGPVPYAIHYLLNSTVLDINVGNTDISKAAFDIERCGDLCLVKAKREAILDVFSSSDLYCLDDAISMYGKMNFNDLCSVSQDKNWQSADQNGNISIEAIALNCKDGELLLQYLINT